MGGLFSSPAPKQAQYVAPPAAVDPAAAAEEERQRQLAARQRGRAGTVASGYNGPLSAPASGVFGALNGLSGQPKTKLGE